MLVSAYFYLKSFCVGYSVVADDMSVKSQVDTVKQQLQELIDLTSESDDHEPDITTRLKFLAEQISLLFVSQSRYSSDTLLIAFRFFAISASVYNRLRSNVLTLQHIKRLSSVFLLSGGLHESAHFLYLQQKAQLMKPYERHVILLLDEIYVEPKTTYKGGSLQGMQPAFSASRLYKLYKRHSDTLLSPSI